EQVYDAYYAKSLLDILPEGVCSLMTGRSQGPLTTVLYTNGKHEPPLIRQSFGMIHQNCLNVSKLHDAFQHLKTVITTSTNPHQCPILVYRSFRKQDCPAPQMRRRLTVDKDTAIRTSVPACQPIYSGRMSEIGAGCQALSRGFKHGAYHLPGPHTYDIPG